MNSNEKLYEFICKSCKHNYVNACHQANCPNCNNYNQTNRKIK